MVKVTKKKAAWKLVLCQVPSAFPFQKASVTMKSDIIPFYGSENKKMFAIERKAMDRDGMVIQFLESRFSKGCIIDIGAGNGFTAKILCNKERTLIPLEPSLGMIDRSKSKYWVSGVTQHLPFASNSFDGAYATWAFFLSGVDGREEALLEVRRILKPESHFVVIDNAGDDEFCSFAPEPIADDGEWYVKRGFTKEILRSSFRFDSVEEARSLMTFFFGKNIEKNIQNKVIEFKIAAYTLTV